MEQPPIIGPRVKMTGTKALILFSLAAVGIMFLLAYLIRPKPPKENELIQNFYAHRATYERLRDMFLADGHVNRIASYGIAVTNSNARFPIARKPEEVGFPIKRYNEYLLLLNQAGALVASRREWEGSSDPVFLVWVWGGIDVFMHVGICWKDQEPANQVASLYEKRPRGKNRKCVYRHIDGHWYLWTDL